jgi:hypothetical protein
MLIVTLWNINGNCILCVIENKLKGITSSIDDEKSFLAKDIEYLTGKDYGNLLDIIFGFVPLINTIVCLYKILKRESTVLV